ncbi:MAG: FKBP-type peptidyl-prolyl cis-trans isomerase [Bacteroidota bacterium]
MSNLNIIFFALLFLGVSCGTKDKFETTPDGYSFRYHVDTEGAIPEAGDEVYYRMYVRLGDTVVHKSFNNVQNQRPFSAIKIPDRTLLKRKLKPHEDALTIMSPGDSITIYYTTDSLKRKPLGFEDENYIFYDLVMVDVKKKDKSEKPVAKVAKPLPVEDYEVTQNGYPVVFHINKEGQTPRVGEYINFRMYIRNDEKVIFSTEKNKIGKETYKTAPYTITNNISPQMDAFGMMSPGDSLTLYYQIDTMDRKPAGFEDSDMVYYDLVLLDVQTVGEYNNQQRDKRNAEEIKKQAVREREPAVKELLSKTLQQYKNDELNLKLRNATNGLKYMILEPGNGIKIESANDVRHHFYCIMENGEPFGGSFGTGEPYSVLIGTRKVVTGWESGLRLFEEGSKGILIVPSALAYGEAGLEGKVPPNTDLIFYLDIEEVRK